MTMPLLEVRNVSKVFGGMVRAVDDVSFQLKERETLAVVGESGCGKSTLSRLILRLTEPTQGSIHFEGAEIANARPSALKAIRRRMQFVFQDPYSSLDPRMTAGEIVTEPIAVHGLVRPGRDRQAKAIDLLKTVGLTERHVKQWPRQFSGGQRQRLGIIRAFALEPSLIVADEPVSALDVSVRAQVINLLQDLQEEKGTAYLFITHDMATVKHMADRVAVMYLGRIMELAPKTSFFSEPHHPYSQALLSSVPLPRPGHQSGRIVLGGDPPSPAQIPGGCRFHPRCPIAQDICKREVPPLRQIADAHHVACHFAKPWPLPKS
ncbi:ATP-binding cassette domain-containing protein [Aureimonas altamirensis]|uniref:ABC transporter ATP-binding protein n=1 Tax=Aureimonas altamirensis TaxID=370622 RepID=UPI001E61C65F|nr:oligopeptide/dipeptide ABC transporter ATP-binding protein [Aureimonas altamirensis]UHD46437.1 ATP-binding cassette domain-containing protein [Aureimonas altamirensis]